ncbi:MAG: protoporphyrinogen oxidase [Bacteroidales bacterium]|nr:protoporphyrinogen oxidase [Bacteroidales bacterium]
MQSTIHTLIIGSGLTGLSTAHYLKKAGIPFHVVEKESRPGGVIQTVTENGFTYELGPNTGVIGSSEIVELFEDLQGLCELETANENAQKRYILKNGKWEQLPSGVMAGIKTPLFTWKDKFRLLGEPFRSKGKDPHETLSALVKRRMGQSFLDYAIDPFIIGVYAGDPEILVPKYALPKLYNLEQNYGSFIGGAVKKQFEKKTEAEKKITRKVFSARGGLSNLVNALYENAGKENFSFRAVNLQVVPEEGGYKVSWQTHGEKREINARKVVFTGGSFALPDVFPFIEREKLEKITRLRYAKIVEVTLGFKAWKGIELNGFGGLIPSREKRDILGVLYMSTLFENRAPKGGALLTIFMGGIRNENLANQPDDKIKEVVEREITDLMQLPEFQPDLFKITRYDYAIPQYEVNSGERFETIAELEKEYPGLILGGNMRDGIGMADRAKQGKMLAEQVKNPGL